MAVVGSLVSTLADLGKQMDANGNIARIIEILNQQNEMLEDVLWMECNDGTGHTSAIRTGLPLGTWRMLYQGVQPSKTSRAQIKDTCGMLENYSEPDKKLVDISKNPAEFRLSEARGIMEGMNQQLQQVLMYGNQLVTPQTFTGLSPRFNSLSAGTGANIIDAGGTGIDNTSIWYVVWGDDTCFGLYPQGTPAGIQHRDLGQHTKTLSDGSMYEIVRDHFEWNAGLAIRDWRYVVRIANIDVSDLSTDVNKLKALVSLMIQASELMRTPGMGKAAWYMNRNTASKLRLAILEKVGLNLTFETVNGKNIMAFDGVPVRRVEQILNSEARVV